MLPEAKFCGWKFIKPRCNCSRRSRQRVIVHCYPLTSQILQRCPLRDFGGKQFHCQMSCDLEVTNESACCQEEISSYVTIFLVQLNFLQVKGMMKNLNRESDQYIQVSRCQPTSARNVSLRSRRRKGQGIRDREEGKKGRGIGETLSPSPLPFLRLPRRLRNICYGN